MTSLAYSPRPLQLPPRKAVISLPWDSIHCAYGQLATAFGSQNTASGTWTTANTAVAVPFMVWEPLTVYKLGWMNGSAAGGNSDIALYDASYNRLVSAGATVVSGNSAVQWVDVADTALAANTLYWCAVNHSAITANQCHGLASGSQHVSAQVLCGLLEQAVGASALPNPLVPATMSVVRFMPTMLLATVSGVS